MSLFSVGDMVMNNILKKDMTDTSYCYYILSIENTSLSESESVLMQALFGDLDIVHISRDFLENRNSTDIFFNLIDPESDLYKICTEFLDSKKADLSLRHYDAYGVPGSWIVSVNRWYQPEVFHSSDYIFRAKLNNKPSGIVKISDIVDATVSSGLMVRCMILTKNDIGLIVLGNFDLIDKDLAIDFTEVSSYENLYIYLYITSLCGINPIVDYMEV